VNDHNLRPGYNDALKARSLKRKHHRPPSMSKLVEMQDEMHLMTMDRNLDCSDRVKACSAWKDLEMLRRLMKGKPLSVQAAKPDTKKASISHMANDLDVEQAA